MKRFWNWFYALPGWQRIAVLLGYVAACGGVGIVSSQVVGLLPTPLAMGIFTALFSWYLGWVIRDQIRWSRKEREMQARWDGLMAEMYARAHGGESQLEDPDGPDEPGGPHGS